MKRALLLVLLALGITTMTAQSVIDADPARPLENGSVTITYRPALDDKDGNFNMKDVSEVWVYTGARGAAIAQDPSAPYYEKYGWNDLKNYPELKLKNNGDGTHTLVIENIRAFYNVPDDKPVRELLFVFRNVDGTVQGSDRLLAVDPVGGNSTSMLRLVNGVSTSTTADVIAAQANDPQITEIGFQLASTYKEVPAGNDIQVKAKATGAPAPIYADVVQNLTKDAKYTLLIGDNNDEFGNKFLTDNATLKEGMTQVRFVHWSPATPKVDVLALTPNGPLPVISGAAYGDVKDYFEVPAGTYKFAVAAAGSTDPLVTFNPVDLPGNAALTVIAFGNADGLTRVRCFIDNGNGRDFVDLLPLGEGWIVKANPATPAISEGVTVQYNPENDKKDGQFKMVGVEDVYVYTGARDYTGGYYEKAGWGDVGTTEAVKLTKNADGTFSWTIPSPISAFYPGADGKILKEILMVFRNADGTKQGGDITLFLGDGSGKTVTTEPADVSATAPVAVTYYPWNDKKDNEFKMVGQADVYVYTGGICEDGTYLEKAGWGNVGTTEGLKLTANTDGTHTWNVANLNEFYAVPADKKLKEILLVFRNAEGTKQGSDVKIPVGAPSSVEDEKLAAAINLYPNPTTGSVAMTLPVDQTVSILVLNHLGQTVSTFTATGSATWNGMDMNGRLVAPGSYYVKVRSSNATAVVPVAIVR